MYVAKSLLSQNAILNIRQVLFIWQQSREAICEEDLVAERKHIMNAEHLMRMEEHTAKLEVLQINSSVRQKNCITNPRH